MAYDTQNSSDPMDWSSREHPGPRVSSREGGDAGASSVRLELLGCEGAMHGVGTAELCVACVCFTTLNNETQVDPARRE